MLVILLAMYTTVTERTRQIGILKSLGMSKSSIAWVIEQEAIIVSVLGPLGYILVLFAMRIAPISHIAPARELATLAGAYMGSKLLSERTTPERIIGAVCIVVGVVSLSFAR